MATHYPQMLTASRLRDGMAVWWRKGEWVVGFKDAELLSDEASSEAALKAAEAFVARNMVVNPYLFEVRVREGQIKPLREKEIIRSEGPSPDALARESRDV